MENERERKKERRRIFDYVLSLTLTLTFPTSLLTPPPLPQTNEIFSDNNNKDARAAHRLLLQRMDAIDSHFRSSYGMVAILLRRHALAQAKELVEKSFGSYLPSWPKPRKPSAEAVESSSGAGGGAFLRVLRGGGAAAAAAAALRFPAVPGGRTSAVSTTRSRAGAAARVEDIRATLDGMASVLQGFDLAEVRPTPSCSSASRARSASSSIWSSSAPRPRRASWRTRSSLRASAAACASAAKQRRRQ